MINLEGIYNIKMRYKIGYLLILIPFIVISFNIHF